MYQVALDWSLNSLLLKKVLDDDLLDDSDEEMADAEAVNQALTFQESQKISVRFMVHTKCESVAERFTEAACNSLSLFSLKTLCRRVHGRSSAGGSSGHRIFLGLTRVGIKA